MYHLKEPLIRKHLQFNPCKNSVISVFGYVQIHSDSARLEQGREPSCSMAMPTVSHCLGSPGARAVGVDYVHYT